MGRQSTGVVIAIQSAIPTVPTVPTSTDAVAQGAGGGERRCLAARERERASEIANGVGGGSDESSKTSNTSEFLY